MIRTKEQFIFLKHQYEQKEYQGNSYTVNKLHLLDADMEPMQITVADTMDTTQIAGLKPMDTITVQLAISAGAKGFYVKSEGLQKVTR